MFDLTSSKLLILAVVALIVVGPKDLPALLRTLGYYMGMIRRQANEFRSQFEEAMRETELADLKKEVEQLGKDTTDTIRETTSSIESQMSDVSREFEAAATDANQSLASDPSKPADTLSGAEPLPALASMDPGAVEPAPAPVAPTPAQPKVMPSAQATAQRAPAPAETGA